MAQTEVGGGRLFDLYARYVGEPQSRKDVYGYWTMVLGYVVGLAGVVVFLVLPSGGPPNFAAREAAIVMAAVGLPLGLLGIVLLLPVRRRGIQASVVGVVAALAAVAWFVVAYPDEWIAATPTRTYIIAAYGAGVAIVAAVAALVPVATGEQSFLFESEGGAAREHPAVMTGEAERGALYTVFDGDGENWRWWLIEQSALAGGIETYLSHLETEEAVETVKEAVRRARLLEIRNAAFRLYEADDGGIRWRLMRENGAAVAESPDAFEDRAAAENSVSLLKEHGPTAEAIDVRGASFDLIEDDGAVRWQLIDEDHQPIAAGAPEYGSRADAEAAIDRVRSAVGEAGTLAIDTFGIELYDEGEEWRWRLLDAEDSRVAESEASWSSRRAAEEAVYDVLESVGSAPVLEAGAAGYEVYREGGSWRWRFVDADGDVAAEAPDDTSTGAAAERGAERMRSSVASADVTVGADAAFEVYPDGEAWRWRLVSDDRERLAHSAAGYEDRETAEAAVAGLREQALAADLIEFENAAFQLYEAGGEWRWRLIDEDGNVMADSGEDYASRDDAAAAMTTLKQNAPEAELLEIETAAFELFDEEGIWGWRLVDETGREVAEAGVGYDSRDAAREAMDAFVGHAEDTEGRAMEVATFQLYPDDDTWRWRLVHPDGDIVARSADAYATRDEAGTEVDALREDAAEAPVHDVGTLAIQVVPGDERWRWRLIDGRRDPVATGTRAYGDREAIRDAVTAIREHLPDAAVFDLETLAFRLEPDGEGWTWRLIDEDRAELARASATFEDREAAERAMERVRSLAPDASLIDFDGAAFEYVEDGDGWNWRLIDESSTPLARGAEPVATREDAERHLEAVRELVTDASILEIETAAFELSEDDGEWRWRLLDEDGNRLGRSVIAYPTRGEAREAMNTVKEFGPDAMTTVIE